MIPLMMQKNYKPQGWRKIERQVLHSFLISRNVGDTEACCAGSGFDHGHEAVARCRSCHALHAVCPLLLFSFFLDFAPYHYSVSE